MITKLLATFFAFTGMWGASTLILNSLDWNHIFKLGTWAFSLAFIFGCVFAVAVWGKIK